MTAYIGEIRIFAGNFAPVGWLFCQGQLLPIREYEALYALIGTTYGGDGSTTFALPNQTGRLVVGQGQLPGGSNYQMGQMLGAENVQLTGNHLPTHGHPMAATIGVPETGTAQTDPTNAYFGNGGGLAYTSALGTNPGKLASEAVRGNSSVAGGSQPHSNIQPVQAINYIISMSGVYPSPD
jgi:microcystin-dependent protein